MSATVGPSAFPATLTEPIGRPGTSRTYALDPDAWLDLAPRAVTRRLVAAGVLRYAGRRIIVCLERPAFWDDSEVVGAVAAAFARTRSTATEGR